MTEREPASVELARVEEGPSPELQRLEARAQEYAQARRAATTVKRYAADWETFQGWTEAHGLDCLPASPRTVANFLAYLADAGRKVSGINVALAAIGFYHREAGLDWYPGHLEIARTMKGIRRTLGTAQTRKAAISGELLERMCGSLEPVGRGLMYRAILTVGWFGALRRKEIVDLAREDLRFEARGERAWMFVRLRRRKTDQEGAGTDVAICEQPGSSACPVRTMRAWLLQSGGGDGPLFHIIDGRSVALMVKSVVASVGLDPDDYGGHSLRAGLATTAAAKGRSLAAIMRQTGHASEKMALLYIRPSELTVDNVTEGILEGV